MNRQETSEEISKTKKTCLDLHFASRLRKYTRLKDIRNFMRG